MKRSKRILAIIMAIAVAVSLSVWLMADADEGVEGSITIYAPEGLTLEGQTFDLYKIFSVSTIKGGKDKDGKDLPDKYAYTLDGDFTAFSDTILKIVVPDAPNPAPDEKTLHQYLVDLAETVPPNDWLNPAMVALTDPLSRYVESHTVTPVVTEVDGTYNTPNPPTNPAYTSITFSDLASGYYLVIGSGYSAADDNKLAPTDPEYSSGSVTGVHILVTITDELPDAVIDEKNIEIKAEVPSIDKFIWNRHDHKDEDGEEDAWGKWDDTSIGDIVKFRIDTEVPKMTGYKVLQDKYLFTVHDKMSKGLTLDRLTYKNDIEVYYGGTKEDFDNSVPGVKKLVLGYESDFADYAAYVAATDYTVSVTWPEEETLPDPDLNTYIDIEFVPEKFVNYTPGTKIYIYFPAELNDKAIIEEDGNPNDVQLEYSNSPYGLDSGFKDRTNRTPWKRVRAYTGVLDIVKFESGNPSNLLAGAKFELYNDDNGGLGDKIWLLFMGYMYPKAIEEEGLIYYPTPTPTPTPSPTPTPDPMDYIKVYKVVPSGTSGAVDTFVTPANGQVKILGLGAGTEMYRGTPSANDKLGIYRLVEIEAPEGFFLPEEPNGIEVQVMIECIYDGIDTFPQSPAKGIQFPEWWLNEYDPLVLEWQPLPGEFWVPNRGGPEFPRTGGSGRTIFFIGGVALMGLAVVGLVVVSARKKRKIVID